jgi:hypothetical protein
VRKFVEEFFSGFHREHMKPRGYRKQRHRFSRAMNGYAEVFDFQGSAWNDSSRPWRFHINVCIQFPDIADRPGVRTEYVVVGAPQHFDLPDPVPPLFAKEIAGLLAQASESVATQLPEIHEAFSGKRYWIGF